MKILFSGGGTLGPVTPLLAMHETIEKAHPDAEFLWIGTASGPERALVKEQGIPFYEISGGKMRRYASVENVTDIFRAARGFFQAFRILWNERPSVCISAGGFISVPVHAAAWLLGTPTWVHEQDAEIGLASRLMAPLASAVTTALEENVKKFSKKKTYHLGNPIRRDVMTCTREDALRFFGFDPKIPVVFATGGGTGSEKINALVAEAVPHLAGLCQILHLTGRERSDEAAKRAAALFPLYRVERFFGSEMKYAYAAADIVVARAGFGTLSEIAARGLAALLIPKSGHQEENARALGQADAAIVLDERTATGYHLAAIIKELLRDSARRNRMGETLNRRLPVARAKDIMQTLHALLP